MSWGVLINGLACAINIGFALGTGDKAAWVCAALSGGIAIWLARVDK